MRWTLSRPQINCQSVLTPKESKTIDTMPHVQRLELELLAPTPRPVPEGLLTPTLQRGFGSRLCSRPVAHSSGLGRRSARGFCRRFTGRRRLCLGRVPPVTDRRLRGKITEAITVQLDVKTLSAQPQQVGSQRPVIACELQGGLDREPLNHVRSLAHQLFERHAPNEFCQL